MDKAVKLKRGPKPKTEAYRQYIGKFMCQWYSRVQSRSGLSQDELEPKLHEQRLDPDKALAMEGRNLRRHRLGQAPNSATFAAMQSVALKNGWINPLMGMMHIMTPAEYDECQRQENWSLEMDERDWTLEKRAVELEQQAAALLSEARSIQRYLYHP